MRLTKCLLILLSSFCTLVATGCSPQLLRSLNSAIAAELGSNGSGGGGGGGGGFSADASGLRGMQAAYGDFDKNGTLDVVFVSQSADAVLYASGNGAGGFAVVVSTATIETPIGVTAGDLDRDGNLDLFVTTDNGRVEVLIGNGDGTFGASTAYAAGGINTGIAVGRFDNDGDLDAVISILDTDQIAILPGNLAGTLGAATTYAVGDAPAGVAAGVLDLNGTANDGKLSVVVANTGDDNISVMLGDGAGVFAAAVNYSMGTAPVGVALGDFNKDGKLDVVTANSGSNNISVRTGVGDGTFGAEVTYNVGTTPVGVVVADFNMDGDLDLAVTNYGSDNLSVLLGGAGATFGAAANTATSATPIAVVAGDYDRNGEPDAVAIEVGDNVPTVVPGTDPADPATVSQTTVAGNGPCDAALGDVDNDGDLDMIFTNFGSSTVFVSDNNGSGGFPANDSYVVGGGAAQPCGIELADFNEDGWLDFVVALRSDAEIRVYTNDRDGTFTLADTDSTYMGVGGGTPWDVEVGDIDKDGDIDVIAIGTEFDSNTSIEVFDNDGSAAFATSDVISNGNNNTWRGNLADLDNDGDLDIAVAVRDTADLVGALNDGAGGFPVGFTTIMDEALNNDVHDVLTADINRDGWLDFLIANDAGDVTQDRELQYVANDGTGALGSFLAAVNTDVTAADGNGTAVLSGDFDLDGDLDAAITLLRDGSVEVMTSDATTGFTGFTTTDTEVNCTDSGWGDVGDINHDGALDFVVACSTDNTMGIYISD